MKQNWRNVIFTDECRVNLDGPDGLKEDGCVRIGQVGSVLNVSNEGAQYYFLDGNT